MEFEGRARIRPGFDIAPLVDVVFLLHIFFLLTMTYMAPQALEVVVPGSATGAAAPEGAVVVVVDGDDRILLDGQPMSADTLRQRLTPRFAAPGSPRAEVAADAHASVQGMVTVLDTLRQAGARELYVVTRPLAGEEKEREAQ